MRKKRDEIERTRRRLTEQRIFDAVDRSVEQRTEAAEKLLRYVRTTAVWMGWNGNALPLKLHTGDGFLHLAYE